MKEGGRFQGLEEAASNAKISSSHRSRLFAPTAASKARQANAPSPEPGGFIDLSKSSAELAGPPLFEPKASKLDPGSPSKPNPGNKKLGKAGPKVGGLLSVAPEIHNATPQVDTGNGSDHKLEPVKENGVNHVQLQGNGKAKDGHAHGDANGIQASRSGASGGNGPADSASMTAVTNGADHIVPGRVEKADEAHHVVDKFQQEADNASTNGGPTLSVGSIVNKGGIVDQASTPPVLKSPSKPAVKRGVSPARGTSPSRLASSARGASPARKIPERHPRERAPSPSPVARKTPASTLARTRSLNLDTGTGETPRGRSPSRPASPATSRGISPRGVSPARSQASRAASPSPSPRALSRPASPARGTPHSLSAPTLSSLARRNGEFARASPRSVLSTAAPNPKSAWGLYSANSSVMASTRKALGVESEGSSSSSDNGMAGSRRWSTGTRKSVLPGLGASRTGGAAGSALRRNDSAGSFSAQEDLKISPDLKLDLKGKRMRKLSPSALSPKMEWVSLRDNKLQALEGIDVLKRIKVLHLSGNELKSKSLAALAALQTLQQLFLSSNQLTTLSTLPELPAIGFLAVTQNEITSLEMAPFPRLHTLVASKNYITSLADLPPLPMLQVLKVDDNPVSEDPLARTVAMLLVGKMLRRFNDEEVEPADHFEALSYPPHMTACIRSGFVLTQENNAPEDLERALLDVQSKAGLPPGYALTAASIEQPSEGSPCSCSFDFEYKGIEAKRAPLRRRYQWLKGSRHDLKYDVIKGATSSTYVPGPEDVGKCLRVECTPTLGGIPFPAVFAVSSEVDQGSGIPVIKDIQVEGEAIEGKTLRGSTRIAWNGAQPGNSVISWWRCQDSAHPFTIPEASGTQYTLTSKDIGHSVWFMCLPVAADGTKGEAQFAETATVQPDSPRVTDVRVVGEPLTGRKLTAQATYQGGVEGGSVLEWFSQDPKTGALTDLRVPNNSLEYTPSDSDVGRTIVFRYTPVNSHGLSGEPVSASTPSPVKLSPPELADVAITGALIEGGTVSISSRYVGGGTEGKTKIQWLKSKYPKLYGSLGDSAVIEIRGPTTEREFPIPVDVIGWFLGAKVTPVRLDGVAGTPVYVAASEPVVLRPPSVMRISIEGALVCGEMVRGSYEYAGGKEGYSQIGWYIHQDEADPGTLIQGSIGQKSRLLTRKEVGKWVSFRCTPKRQDGTEGHTQSAMSMERVKPVPLKLAKLSISGLHMEGELMTAQHHVADEHREDWGSYLQEMTYHWYRSELGSRTTFAPLPKATSADYRATIEDVGRVLRCEARARDAFGRLSDPVQVFSGLVEPAPPSVTNVRLEGEAESGAVLRGLGEFRGGVEGASRFEWFRQDYTDGALYPLFVPNNAPEYVIPESEVGRRIIFKYTPISTEGKMGEPVFATSPIIELAAPKVTGLGIVGSLLEGSRVSLLGKYAGGGKEGQSEVQWFKARDGGVGTSMEALPQFDNRKEFLLPAEVVDLHLIAKYTPIRIDGEKGEPSFVASKTTVRSLPPSVVSIHLEGEMQAGATITAQYRYVGGVEGVSHYGWYLHETPNGPGALIPGSIGLKERLLTSKEVGKFLAFIVTPRRNDGLEGETKSFVSRERIMPEPLQLRGLSISGEPVEGETLTAVPSLPADREQWDKFKKEFQYQWYRSAAIGSSDFSPLQGETSTSYTATFEDIGRRIKCECSVTDYMDRSSRPVAAITPPVEAAPPSIRDVAFEGHHAAGSTLRGIGSYFGGKQGASRYEWFRENIRTGEFEPLNVPNNSPEYMPGVDDVGRRIMFKYTPINSYRKAGQTVTVTSEPVKPSPPRVVDLSIRGELVEGSTVTVHAFYVGGGEEGLSRIQWFKSRSPSTGGGDLVEIGHVQTRRDLVVPSEAVGWYLLANYTPVRSDGVSGEAVQVVSTKPVGGLPPKITAIQLSGRFVEGETLKASYEYSGGYEGNSVYGWYLHENEQDPGVLIPGSVGLKERVLTKRDVGKLVSFKCTPRREEGLEGPSRTAMSPDRIAAAPPECKNLRIVGSAVEQGVLRAEKEYVGGYEGASIYRWYVTQPGEVQKRIQGATTSSYKVRPEDVDCMISVACTPVRVDGVNGDQQWASPVGPISGGRSFLVKMLQ